MNSSILKRYFILKDLLFFIILILVQIISLFFINLFNNNFLILKDSLIIITIQYSAFFLTLFIIWKIDNRNLSFISNENWFLTLGKALIPSIIAFGVAFIFVMLIISIVEFLPFPNFIKEWVKVPNQGFIEIFENIDKRESYKVIIWFFYIIIVAPIVEEITFRGFLQEFISKILKRFNLDIIITSIVFSIFHISSLSNALYSFIVGLFLSSQRRYYKSINISIWIHSLINFTGVVYGILLKYYMNKLNL